MVLFSRLDVWHYVVTQIFTVVPVRLMRKLDSYIYRSFLAKILGVRLHLKAFSAVQSNACVALQPLVMGSTKFLCGKVGMRGERAVVIRCYRGDRLMTVR
uniref:Uncharacterized protein n=1 Tax=Schistocephalus solidus TaxID=70667 RepID=A0A0X3PVW3_SCHSO